METLELKQPLYYHSSSGLTTNSSSEIFMVSNHLLLEDDKEKLKLLGDYTVEEFIILHNWRSIVKCILSRSDMHYKNLFGYLSRLYDDDSEIFEGTLELLFESIAENTEAFKKWDDDSVVRFTNELQPFIKALEKRCPNPSVQFHYSNCYLPDKYDEFIAKYACLRITLN